MAQLKAEELVVCTCGLPHWLVPVSGQVVKERCRCGGVVARKYPEFPTWVSFLEVD